jgi:hypothetical protein
LVDFERDAIGLAHDCFVVAADKVPRRGNSDARGTPNTAVGVKILPRCSRPEIVVERPTYFREISFHAIFSSR